MQTKTTKHSVYNLNYHIVFVTKYRHKVFKGAIEDFVKAQVQDICERYGWEQLALEVMPDHIHLFVSAPPVIAPNTMAKTIKSMLTVAAGALWAKQFKGLKKRYFWGSGLFSDGCYYGSAGTVSSATIQKYIENQKTAR